MRASVREYAWFLLAPRYANIKDEALCRLDKYLFHVSKVGLRRGGGNPYPQGADSPLLFLCAAKAGRNNLNKLKKIPLLLPTEIGERYSHTISNICLAAPLCLCKLQYKRNAELTQWALYMYVCHYFETVHISKSCINQDDSKPIFLNLLSFFLLCDPGTRILRPKGARGKHCHILSVLSKWIWNFPHISGVNMYCNDKGMVKYCHPFVGNCPDLGQEIFASVIKENTELFTVHTVQCHQHWIV